MKARKLSENDVAIYCPGCGYEHTLRVAGSTAIWQFNGDYEIPTFSPSLLVTGGHYASGEQGKPCWCTFEARYGKKAPFSCVRCHSFVRDGRIQFLTDSTHALAGQTVDLPDVTQNMQGN